jgi:hypothetical protein
MRPTLPRRAAFRNSEVSAVEVRWEAQRHTALDCEANLQSLRRLPAESP